jgi:protein MpaA
MTDLPPAPPVASTKPATRPAERVVELGRSVEGRALTVHVFGDGADLTLVLGGIHGNEPTSATVAQRLLEYLREHPGALPAGGSVAILPVANPDGLARRLRTNKNLVDVNRNFPAANWAKRRRSQYYGGAASSSEPETLAIVAAFEQLRPARVISIHSMDAPCNNYDGPALALAERIARHNGYPVKDNIGYPTPGSLGNWAGVDQQIPVVTLELPRKADANVAWEQNRAALLDAIGPG